MDDRAIWTTASAFPSRLKTLSGLLDKAAAFAEARGRPFHELAQARLAPDMFPLNTQVLLACWLAWEPMVLLSGGERPEREPLGESLAELKARIDETVRRMEAMSQEAFEGAAARRITLPLLGAGLVAEFSGAEYLRDWSLPNFHFHFVTAYDILRHEGVELGKADYMAHIGYAIRKAG